MIVKKILNAWLWGRRVGTFKSVKTKLSCYRRTSQLSSLLSTSDFLDFEFLSSNRYVSMHIAPLDQSFYNPRVHALKRRRSARFGVNASFPNMILPYFDQLRKRSFAIWCHRYRRLDSSRWLFPKPDSSVCGVQHRSSFGSFGPLDLSPLLSLKYDGRQGSRAVGYRSIRVWVEAEPIGQPRFWTFKQTFGAPTQPICVKVGASKSNIQP